jgi:transcription initiation factor TFIIH subunit 1
MGTLALCQSNICPKSDGTNVTYNLSFDDIQSIFKTYPSGKLWFNISIMASNTDLTSRLKSWNKQFEFVVRQKYLQNVPHKISEVDFWTKFFQSHYFHRDRITNNTADLFSDCVSKDEEGLDFYQYIMWIHFATSK